MAAIDVSTLLPELVFTPRVGEGGPDTGVDGGGVTYLVPIVDGGRQASMRTNWYLRDYTKFASCTRLV